MTGITERPVFVVGAPRSGTSMMQWSLREHPELWGGPESDFFIPLANATRQAHAYGSVREKLHWLSRMEVTESELLRYVGLGLNQLYTERAGGLRWVEQTPEYTIHLDDIRSLFPGAQYLFMLRDGRDVVHSLRHFVNPVPHEEACRRWAAFCQAGLSWMNTEPDPSMHVVRYEEIVDDPHEVLSGDFDFLGVEDEPACGDSIRDGRINSSFGEEADREPGWWSWSKGERKRFRQTAGELLIELGFESDHSWVER